ncbi:hypothetical protein GCM10008097_03930 [Mycetocola manganoxydans]|nr:hypothetical protein GCM10008097_03930 [Mycetocola manganoxydans]
MADGQDEPVASQPVLIARVTAHDFLEEQVSGRGEAHRRTRVTVPNLLDRIRCEETGGINRRVVNGIPLQSCHSSDPSDRRRRAISGPLTERETRTFGFIGSAGHTSDDENDDWESTTNGLASPFSIGNTVCV